jgi:serine/threonine protein kinase/WD40 repeat protein/tetratricopeptide (TPR) repeat protein
MTDAVQSERVALLADEFLDRRRRGEYPSIQEYVEKYPELVTEIRSVFPAVAMLEHVAVTDGGQSGPTAEATPAVGQVGDFRIIREIGRGGMGVVYEAEQLSLGRFVALKLLANRVDGSDRHRERFLREARTAAKLHHTNIVPVFGFGTTDGIAYYAMQFIRGQGLDAVIQELRAQGAEGKQTPAATTATRVANLARSLVTGSFESSDPDRTVTPHPPPPTTVVQANTAGTTTPALSGAFSDKPGRYTLWAGIARLGVQVAHALEYAHQQGVLHRDVKPSNLLLDLSGTVWVTDFGLAKAEGLPDITRAGDLLGTLRYMPPEAFEGRADARSDVYSLGLTLYELLALRPAFDEHDRAKLVRQVTESDPPPVRKVAAGLPRDLATIVGKAIEKEPRRRYQTAGALADDLQRFLDGRTIAARRVGEVERVWKWARRRPGMAAMIAASLLFLVSGLAFSIKYAVQADESARNAQHREQDANVARDMAQRAEKVAARQTAELRLDRGIQEARGGEPARALHHFVQALRTLPLNDPASAPLERVIRMNLTAWAETVPALEHILPGGPDGGDSAFSPDGSLIACRVAPDEIQCLRTDTGVRVGVLKHPMPPFHLATFHGFLTFAPDGKSLWVATVGPNTDATSAWAIHRLDPLTGDAVQPPIPSRWPVGRLVATPDGKHLAGFEFTAESQSPSNQPGFRKSHISAVIVWDTRTGDAHRVAAQGEYWQGTTGLSADGKTVTAHYDTVGGQQRFISIPLDRSGPTTDTPSQAAARTFRADRAAGLRIDPKGLTTRWTENARSGDALTWATPFHFEHGQHHSPSGRELMSRSERRLFDVGCWPPRPSGMRFEMPGSQSFKGMYDQFSPDEQFVVTGVMQPGKEKWLWRLPRVRSRPQPPPGALALQPTQALQPGYAKFDAGRERLVIRHGPFPSADVRVVDVNTGAIRGLAIRHNDSVHDIAFSHDGQHFGTASRDHGARVWEAATGKPAGSYLQHPNFASALAFHTDGTTLAVADYTNLVVRWNWQTGKNARPPLQHDDIVMGLRISPDGRYLAAVKAGEPGRSGKEELWFWDLDTGKDPVRLPYERWTDGRYGIEFRPDSGAVCGVDRDGVLRLWEVPTGNLLGECVLDGRRTTRFTRDSRILAIAESRGVRLLDAHTLAPLPGGLLPHSGEVQELAFNSDGTLLLAGCNDGSAQLWDVSTRKPLGPPAVLMGSIAGVEFSADGRTCIAVAPDGTVRRWPVPTPFDEPNLTRLADRVALMTAQRMDENAGMAFIPKDEWVKLRADLVGTGSTALVPPMPEAEWHDARLADAEQDGDTYGAEWHLARLTALRPDDWTVAARRGRNLLLAGRRDEAATAYAEARRLAPSPAAVVDWLRAASADNEFRRRTEAAVWNLSRAVELTSDDWTLYFARSKLLTGSPVIADEDEAIRRGADARSIDVIATKAAQSGDWKRVAEVYSAVRDLDAPVDLRTQQALGLLKAGKLDVYKSVCSAVTTQRPPVHPQFLALEANNAARIFAYGPDATDDWKKPLDWTDHAMAWLATVEKNPKADKAQLRGYRHMFLNTRGAVLYRADQHEEAVKVLREGMGPGTSGGGFHDWVFLALAEHKLGHTKEANQAAAKARETLPKHPPERVWARAEVELLRAELDAVIPPSGK